MHFTSANTNFLTQGGAALDPCQGLCLWRGPIDGPNPHSGVLALRARCFSPRAIPKSRKPCIKHVVMGYSDSLNAVRDEISHE